MITLQKQLEDIKKIKKWYHKSFSGYLYGIYEQALAILHTSKHSKYKEFALKKGICFEEYTGKERFDWFWDVNEMKEMREKIISRQIKDGKFIDGIHSYWRKQWESLIKYYDSIDLTKLKQSSPSEIKRTIEKLHQLYVEEAGTGYLVDTFLSDEGDWLVDTIKGELGQDTPNDIIEALTLPAYSSFVNDSELGLLRIAKLIRDKKTAEARKLCHKYVKDFFWIKTTYLEFAPIDEEYVWKEALAIESKTSDIDEKIKEEKLRIENNIKRKNAALKKYDASERLRRIIHAAEIFTHIQDKRKEGVLRTNTVFLGMLFHVGKQKGLENIIGYINYDEFVKFLDGKKLDWDEIRKRRDEGVANLFFDGRYEFIPKRKYNESFIMSNFFHEHGEVSEIRGSIAYRGFVKGVVSVLRNTKEIALFKEGNILVTNQTTPEFVPAMKKAAAIVTDQGGITAHAAIIARELKKPCIIGTKIATKVLKDGDIVEVDANTGIVRKIK